MASASLQQFQSFLFIFFFAVFLLLLEGATPLSCYVPTRIVITSHALDSLETFKEIWQWLALRTSHAAAAVARSDVNVPISTST